MKNSIYLIAAGLALAFLGISQGPAAEKSETQKDLDKIQGEWTMISGLADGYAVPEEMLRSSKRTCKGDETTVMVGGQLIMKAKFTLDATRKPKTIDYQVTDGPTKGKRLLGIYELEGDIVKFCFGSPGAERPGDYSSQLGQLRTSSVWKKNTSPKALEK